MSQCQQQPSTKAATLPTGRCLQWQQTWEVTAHGLLSLSLCGEQSMCCHLPGLLQLEVRHVMCACTPKALTVSGQASSSISMALVAHLCDVSGETDCTAAAPAGVHATLRNLVHVAQDLGLADSRVAHQQHIELTPHAATLKLLHQPVAT